MTSRNLASVRHRLILHTPVCPREPFLSFDARTHPSHVSWTCPLFLLCGARTLHPPHLSHAHMYHLFFLYAAREMCTSVSTYPTLMTTVVAVPRATRMKVLPGFVVAPLFFQGKIELGVVRFYRFIVTCALPSCVIGVSCVEANR